MSRFAWTLQATPVEGDLSGPDLLTGSRTLGQIILEKLSSSDLPHIHENMES